MSARIVTPVALVILGLLLQAGCASSRCLELPASSSLLSDEDVGRCKRAVDASPARRDLLARYAALLRLRGGYAELERVARRAVAADAGRTDARYYLAFALRKQGQARAALAEYRAYAARRPKDADPHYGIALCHEQLGDRSASIAAYRRYLALEGRAARVSWRRLAEARVAALAGGAALAGVEAPPSSPALDSAAAAAEPGSPVATAEPPPSRTPSPAPPPVPGPPAGAPPPEDCSNHERAVAADPFAIAAYDSFAACAGRAGRYRDVVRRMRIALRDNPGYARGWLHLGRAKRALGREAAAKAALAKACAAGVTEAC